ncbi:hypothetical protein [Flavobacterium limi]|uniref:Lipoprotein n=1 Tax=Flavobacterium limi TaxID=2045105 RepID=A0ABQ1TPL5_9FLAO|nr:hypothetical protein [Flavobacterium limi]GGF00710.1 hypothetical protein GCM10011518_07670 [Flavobacterium limi]
MNTNFRKIALLFLALATFASCDDSEGGDDKVTPPSASEFAAVRDEALAGRTQHFTATAGNGNIVLTSKKGVKINLNGDCLKKAGVAVTGTIDIEYVELFDKGDMLVTNKPTMGLMPDGKKNLLISGGEFYIKATQNGQDLTTTCGMYLIVPTGLTGGYDNQMTLWFGNIDEEDNLVWREAKDGADGTGGKGGVQGEANSYYVTFGNFGWANVDRFYSDPRPKTTILVDAPEGFDNTNSAVYLSYDGEGTNALAQLDTYTAAGLFSEHYGQIPIGLACHIIFATEENGQWRYAIKGVTTTANAVYSFTLAETTVGSEAQLVAAINAIQ